MRYLLIDTNCLIDLLADEAEEKSLRILEHCVIEKQIRLIIPKRLKEEWYRQKECHFNKLRESINVGFKGFERSTQKRLKQEVRRLEVKAKKIETLLLAEKECPATKSVHAEVGYRKSKGLAPYHISPLSDGDAYIYFSAIAHVKSRRISNFIFITHDKKAFSQVGDERQLHPDLCVKGVTVEYLYGVGIGMNRLKELFGFRDGKAETNVDFDSIFYLFKDEKKFSSGKRIYKALDAYYDQLPFIPTQLLAKVYPFKIVNTKNGITYNSSFQLNTNNEEVARYFAGIQIGDKNEIKFTTNQGKQITKQQAFTILYRLNQNLIFDISAIGSNTEADIRLKKEFEPTIQDWFNEFDFLKAHQMLKSKPSSDTRETLRQAYLHFQFGYFDEAMLLFDAVYERSKSNGRRLLEFVALYNMKRVEIFINSYYLSKNEKTKSIIKKIGQQSLRQYLITYDQEPSFVQECIRWITDNDYHQETYIELSETLEKIRDHYHTQLRGGFSSNSNYIKLLSQYLELDQFLEQNCIVFNTYSNYEQITAKLAEGLMMMHTFNDKQPGRLEILDSVLLKKLIMYGKRETLVNHYKRLFLTGISEKNENNKKMVLKTAERFFADYHKLRQALIKTEERNPYFFWEKYYKVAGNLLLMVTVSTSTADHTLLAKNLMNVFSEESISHRLEMVHLANFIRTKGKYIQTGKLKQLLSFSIENNKFHNSDIFSAFNMQRRTNHPTLLLKNKTSLNQIDAYFFQVCSKCKLLHEPSLAGEVYHMLSKPFRTQLQGKIIKRLLDNFNPDLYYALAMYDVFDYRLFFDSFIESCPVLKPGKSKHPFFGNAEANHQRLSKLLNLAFKFNFNFHDDVRFQKHMRLSHYYDWLLDIDGFDYTNFNPLWILEYQADAHLRMIFSSPKVIDNLLPYLKRTKHPRLNDLFIQYGIKTNI